MTDAPGAAPMSSESDQVLARLDKRRRLEEAGVDPYPGGYDITHTSTQAVSAFEAEGEGVPVRIAGRVMSRRKMGKATFLHLQDRDGRIQAYCRKDAVGEEPYALMSLLDIGDFAGIAGTMFRTRTGEATVQVESWRFLAKAQRPLPEKWHGVRDKEIRFRQRYLDLAMNEEARVVFRARSRMISAMRRVLDAKDFLEVETPVLQPLYGGANARPFRTEHNALGVTLYLRIADELYLKRCLVGGLDRVYEFGKDFRNEGMDRTHQPEFTQLEAYQAYGNYEDGMSLVEELVAAGAEAACGSTVVEWGGRTLDFGRPWERVSYLTILSEAAGRDLSSLEEGPIREACQAHGIEYEGDPTAAVMLDDLFSRIVQPELLDPTFVIDHPKLMSPLAKGKPGSPHLVERYEPIVCGMEVGNGFSELNDPQEQRARFEDQLKRARRDEDTMVLDEPFLCALEHGMPPASGLGLGIDRLAMILSGADQIREVILFPQMRPEKGEE
ncbi:MAG: lysine--tRNA ligase [Gemmatimonadota bacterium]|jgi:lysyl-tRNA synthetase class 2|nr:lysine--tRNA ligase [Candidatus Woesearchaeota archaeon]MDP6530170.1 lysine--tRNA ligase [Gemmatimonadota bacterium]MDP6802063.1 lysine--tRNA ligase [Gemmatimonadota bacterium]MDP7032443.1 lysine--tRNA ligase [Gemmatimonadota bacterium]